jgi:hypothetical protein
MSAKRWGHVVTLGNTIAADYIPVAMPEPINPFDWLRYIDIPIMLFVAGCLWRHMAHDHAAEVNTAEELGKLSGVVEALKGMDRRQDMILKKLLGENDDCHD